MIVGVPKEIKDNEYRVAMTPGGVRQLVESGHQVLVCLLYTSPSPRDS